MLCSGCALGRDPACYTITLINSLFVEKDLLCQAFFFFFFYLKVKHKEKYTILSSQPHSFLCRKKELLLVCIDVYGFIQYRH